MAKVERLQGCRQQGSCRLAGDMGRTEQGAGSERSHVSPTLDKALKAQSELKGTQERHGKGGAWHFLKPPKNQLFSPREASKEVKKETRGKV